MGGRWVAAVAAALGSALLAGPDAGLGQALPIPHGDTVSGATAVRTVRAGHSSVASEFLVQAYGPRPAAELGVLADSLVEVVAGGGGPEDGATPVAARAALTAVAVSILPGYLEERSRALRQLGFEGALVAFDGGVPTLIRMFERSTEVGLRGAVLHTIAAHLDDGRVIAFLVALASDPDPPDNVVGAQAVRFLAGAEGPATEAILRRLCLEGDATHWSALDALEAIASLRGWIQSDGGVVVEGRAPYHSSCRGRVFRN